MEAEFTPLYRAAIAAIATGERYSSPGIPMSTWRTAIPGPGWVHRTQIHHTQEHIAGKEKFPGTGTNANHASAQDLQVAAR